MNTLVEENVRTKNTIIQNAWDSTPTTSQRVPRFARDTTFWLAQNKSEGAFMLFRLLLGSMNSLP
jgi:hypothetical protein